MSLIQLVDCEVRDIKSHTQYHAGSCPTCDYNSYYEVDVVIVFNNGREYFNKETYSSEDFSLSDWILLFTRNIEDIKKMTKEEFVKFIKEYIETHD